MPAQLLIDDSLTTYSKDEFRFLWMLAQLLPSGTVLHAWHQRPEPRSPLVLAIDLRLVEMVNLPSIGEKGMEAKARGAARRLQDAAKRMMRAMPELVEHRSVKYCEQCGRQLEPVYDKSHARKPRGWECGYCQGKGSDPTLERTVNQAMQGRGSHYGG